MLNGSHTHHAFSVLPPNAPGRPRAIFHATWGPVQASETRPSASETLPVAISPAAPDQTCTVQRRVARSKSASVRGPAG